MYLDGASERFKTISNFRSFWEKKHLKESENRTGKFVMQENKFKPPEQSTSEVGDSDCQMRQDLRKAFYKVDRISGDTRRKAGHVKGCHRIM